jgi:hypothetical protein
VWLVLHGEEAEVLKVEPTGFLGLHTCNLPGFEMLNFTKTELRG